MHAPQSQLDDLGALEIDLTGALAELRDEARRPTRIFPRQLLASACPRIPTIQGGQISRNSFAWVFPEAGGKGHGRYRVPGLPDV